jgi:hypothetical protein
MKKLHEALELNLEQLEKLAQVEVVVEAICAQVKIPGNPGERIIFSYHPTQAWQFPVCEKIGHHSRFRRSEYPD